MRTSEKKPTRIEDKKYPLFILYKTRRRKGQTDIKNQKPTDRLHESNRKRHIIRLPGNKHTPTYQTSGPERMQKSEKKHAEMTPDCE